MKGLVVTSTDIESLVARLPKVELHAHLEGSVRAETAIELADKNGVKLHSDDPAHFYSGRYEQEDFFKQFFGVCNALATQEDCGRAIYEVLCDQAAAGNVRYTELFCQPTMHPTLTYPEMLEGLLDGMKRAEADAGIVCRLLPAINREQSPEVALQLVRDIIDNPRDRVLGIGLDGNPYIPASDFAAAFGLARESGLHRTAHAGVPVYDTREVLDVLGCERVDHGYYVVEDAELLDRVVRDRIHFTACWTLAGEYFDTDRASSPVQAMVDAGMSVSINTDDPRIFHTDIGKEYLLTTRHLGWDLQTAWDRVLDAAASVWLPEDEKQQLHARLKDEADALGLGLTSDRLSGEQPVRRSEKS